MHNQELQTILKSITKVSFLNQFLPKMVIGFYENTLKKIKPLQHVQEVKKLSTDKTVVQINKIMPTLQNKTELSGMQQHVVVEEVEEQFGVHILELMLIQVETVF